MRWRLLGKILFEDLCALVGWRGRLVTLPRNPPYDPLGGPGWKLHRCPDDVQCRSEIPGGCGSGWCGHFGVSPQVDGKPRLPAHRLWLRPVNTDQP